MVVLWLLSNVQVFPVLYCSKDWQQCKLTFKKPEVFYRKIRHQKKKLNSLKGEFFFKFYCAGSLKENTTPAVPEINDFKDDAETWSSYGFIIGTTTQHYHKCVF